MAWNRFLVRGVTGGMVLVAGLIPARPVPGAESGEAGGGRRTITATRISGGITVDGVLDEPEWREAIPVDLPYETYPGENTPARVATECRILYDDHALYLGCVAHDPDPSKIRAHYTDRDRAGSDDSIGVILDTFDDQRRAFEFFVNPFGVQTDRVLNEAGGGSDASWDAIWDSMGRITEEGYVVEVAIPFSSLRFQKTSGPQTWGIELIRAYPREQRYTFASQPLDRDEACGLCQSSLLVGLAGITPGKALELDPTLTSAWSQTREEFPDGPLKDSGTNVDLGLTARWGITPNLVLSGTLNPDFSQVEADSVQLEVNRRFALFYPEKRPFFQEGADYFATPFNVVHTRMVADPSWGVKLTGKVGATALGAFVVRDEITNLIFPGPEGSRSTSLDRGSTAGVFRYRHDLGGSSTLGVIATGRSGDGYTNGVFGTDGLVRLGKSDTLEFQLLGSSTEYPLELAEEYGQRRGRFSGTALSTAYSHDTRNWAWDFEFRSVSEGFRADLGFMPQGGYRFAKARASHTWWGSDGDFFSRFKLGANVDGSEDSDGNRLHDQAEAWISFSAPAQTNGFANLRVGRQFYRGREFDNDGVMFFLSSRPSGALEFRLWGSWGDGIDYAHVRQGTRRSLGPGMVWRAGNHLSTEVAYRHEKLDVEGGTLYTAGVGELRLVYQFNVRAFVRAILQYTGVDRDPGLYAFPVDPSSTRFFSQFLFSYKVNPQTVFFLGYSDNRRGLEGIDLTTTNRTIFLKLGYAWLL